MCRGKVGVKQVLRHQWSDALRACLGLPLCAASTVDRMWTLLHAQTADYLHIRAIKQIIQDIIQDNECSYVCLLLTPGY